jgi:hypothetical protein
MKRYVSLALLAGLFVWTGLALAQEAVTIKIKDPAEGDVVQVEKTEKGTINQKVTIQGMSMEDKKMVSETSAYKETVLKLDDKKRPSKLEREYTKAEKSMGDKAEKLPYDGKTVVIEKKGDKFTFSIKGGKELTPMEAGTLNAEFNKASNEEMSKLLLPKKAVKEKDEWELDIKEIAKSFGSGDEMELDGEKGKGTGKLVKVYKKDGKQFGEIQIKMEIPVKAVGKAPASIKTAEGSKLVLTGTMDACIDGTSHAGTMKMKTQMTVTAMPMGASVAVTADIDTTETQTDGKK